MRDDEHRQWMAEQKERALASWRDRRGLATIDRNGSSVLVRAGVEETAAELARAAVRWEKDVLDKPVGPGATNLIVFRLCGHSWTIIVDEGADAPGLSRSLQTEVIAFSTSDTCGSIGYVQFMNGEQTESFFGSEGDGTNEFESTVRSLSSEVRADAWGLVETFFVARNAFEPGLAYEYFFRDAGEETNNAPRLILPGAASADVRPRVRNPGLGYVIGSEQVLSKPEFERIDLVVTRESHGKAGRILLR